MVIVEIERMCDGMRAGMTAKVLPARGEHGNAHVDARLIDRVVGAEKEAHPGFEPDRLAGVGAEREGKMVVSDCPAKNEFANGHARTRRLSAVQCACQGRLVDDRLGLVE